VASDQKGGKVSPRAILQSNPRKAFAKDAHLICTCRHEMMLHTEGKVCNLKGCECEEFVQMQLPPRERVRRLPTLDRTQPKLFEPLEKHEVRIVDPTTVTKQRY
jgi:hypothetical protein